MKEFFAKDATRGFGLLVGMGMAAVGFGVGVAAERWRARMAAAEAASKAVTSPLQTAQDVLSATQQILQKQGQPSTGDAAPVPGEVTDA